MQLNFNFCGIGPKLLVTLEDNNNNNNKNNNVTNNEENITQIQFGNIEALTKYEKIVTIKNISPIPASLELKTIKDNNTSFQLSHSEMTINPKECKNLQITAFLRDTLKFTDELQIIVKNGNNHNIPILSKGVGTTLKSSINMDIIDLGNQFSNKECNKSFRIENCGKRTQTIVWNYLTAVTPNITEDKNINKQISLEDHEKHETESVKSFTSYASAISMQSTTMLPHAYDNNTKGDKNLQGTDEKTKLSIFDITPNKVTLKPGTAMDFKIIGFTQNEGIM